MKTYEIIINTGFANAKHKFTIKAESYEEALEEANIILYETIELVVREIEK